MNLSEAKSILENNGFILFETIDLGDQEEAKKNYLKVLVVQYTKYLPVGISFYGLIMVLKMESLIFY